MIVITQGYKSNIVARVNRPAEVKKAITTHVKDRYPKAKPRVVVGEGVAVASLGEIAIHYQLTRRSA